MDSEEQRCSEKYLLRNTERNTLLIPNKIKNTIGIKCGIGHVFENIGCGKTLYVHIQKKNIKIIPVVNR